MTEIQESYVARAREWWNGETPEGRALSVHEMMGWHPENEHLLKLVQLSYDDIPVEQCDDMRAIFTCVFIALELKEEHSILQHKESIRVGQNGATFSMNRTAEADGDEYYRDVFRVSHPDRTFSRTDDDIRPADINWSACGAQEPAIAQRMAELLLAGVDYANRVPDPRVPYFPELEKA